jgi:hypothetical protein
LFWAELASFSDALGLGGRFESVKSEREPPLFVAKEGWNPGCIFPLVPSSASCNSNWLPKSGNGVCVRTSPLLRHARPCSELRTIELSLSGILAGHVSERWPGIPRQPIVILFPKYCVRSTKHCLRSPEYSSSYLIPLVHFWNFTTTRSRQAGYRMSKSTNLDKKAVAPSTSYPAALGRTRTSSHWLVDGASWEGHPRGRAILCAGWRHTAGAKSCMVLFVSKMLLAFAASLLVGVMWGRRFFHGNPASKLPESEPPLAAGNFKAAAFPFWRGPGKAYCVVRST